MCLDPRYALAKVQCDLQVYSTTGLGCWSAIWLNSNYPQVYYPNPPRHWPRGTGLVAPPPEISSSTLRTCIQRGERLTLNRTQYHSHSFSTFIHNLIPPKSRHPHLEHAFPAHTIPAKQTDRQTKNDHSLVVSLTN